MPEKVCKLPSENKANTNFYPPKYFALKLINNTQLYMRISIKAGRSATVAKGGCIISWIV